MFRLKKYVLLRCTRSWVEPTRGAPGAGPASERAARPARRRWLTAGGPSLSLPPESKRLAADRLDQPGPAGRCRRLYLVTQVREALEDVFVGMGYEIAEGPEVETVAQLRGSQYSRGSSRQEPSRHLLRRLRSAVERGAAPAHLAGPDPAPPARCAAHLCGGVGSDVPDTPDSNHLPVFHQIEGLWSTAGSPLLS